MKNLKHLVVSPLRAHLGHPVQNICFAKNLITNPSRNISYISLNFWVPPTNKMKKN